MVDAARDLLERALTLPREQRAALAAELIASLDEGREDQAEVERAWAEEITRRARRALSEDDAPGEDWEVVVARLERRLSDRRK